MIIVPDKKPSDGFFVFDESDIIMFMYKDPTPILLDSDDFIKQAEMKIRQIFQMMCQFGAVDSEKDLIENIISDMKDNKISPEKAIEKATEILNNKNGFLTQYR